MQPTYFNKPILIVGLGISGLAAARFLLTQKALVWAIDQNKDKLRKRSDIQILESQGLQFVAEKDLPPLETFLLVVTSPGVPLTHPVLQLAQAKNIKILGEIELAFRSLRNKLIGITGTNGKTTVTLLLTHLLNYAGIPAKAVGNVGEPLSAEITCSSETVLVVELSSFQLDTLQSRQLDMGVILNITPDHLDRYASMEDYALSKMKIKSCIKEGAPLYMEEKAFQNYGFLQANFPCHLYGYSHNCHLMSDQQHLFLNKNIDSILPVEYRGTKSHKLENLMAAYGLCREMGIDATLFWEGVSTFNTPPHRIEKVAIFKDVSYYNDSKGTNIDAVMRAIEAIEGPIILIAGGVDKGTDFSPWISAFANKVKHICVIGQATEKLDRTLSKSFNVVRCQNMHDAVKHASSLAYPGDNVLLSPGCASYDMFENYAHRGKTFREAVNALASIQNT
ncbi:UDP-N-acetylmuramoylalanine--D-glutamate ligase [Parachlamydia acanthamoebae UV-7]|uniref:UDP-N-acetylmuramoylalanine--D-glutamate ligase n=2 Tax=Parachlamydia acanthamoebae TaxID=83552 RepID=F8KYA0_PARAV|nr:UDP-N-acetylmuramoyl-L-alanine--D-glutamate ligase [Parachlamydia acanthamoebae]CCB85835.1 UDP-N-acetylmuramoylalanine--D-glutamate ligase [Parachlamydia acanthamoebae UV-7]